jgi:putative ABC transport system ATP-binding protein
MTSSSAPPTIAAAAAPAIQARGVVREYHMGGEVIRAVNGIDLDIAPGEFAALLGPSGSGKSTLLHLLAGMDHATAGELRVEGQVLNQLTSEGLARYRRQTVGMVFQAFNLIHSMRVYDNVELPLRLAELPRAERDARVRESLTRVGLEHRLDHRPSQLSGGEQQRVALARALVNRPSVLLADEPTGNLDSKNGDIIMRMIQELNESLGMTVVLVTHERALAERYARRMIWMSDGTIAKSEPNIPQASQASMAAAGLPPGAPATAVSSASSAVQSLPGGAT